MKRITTVVIFVSLLAGLVPASDASTTETINFDFCSSPMATNCFESLNIINPDESISTGTLVPGTTSEFEFKGLKFASGYNRAQIQMSWRPDGAPLCWWGECNYHSGSIDIGIVHPTPQSDGILDFPGEDARQCGDKANPSLCLKWFNFGDSYQFALRFRATGFNLGMIAGKARNVKFTDLSPKDKVEGSRTYEILANNILFDSYVINEIRSAQPVNRLRADYVSDSLVLWLWDINNEATSRLPARCNAKNIVGPPTQLLFSTFNMGRPSWNASDSSLSVQLESAHLAFDGSLNKGFYEMVFSKATSQCLWGINPEKSARAEVKISYSDGGAADIATVTQGYRDGSLRITASNFHLSSPIVSTKLLSDNVQKPAETKKTTIICSKGKLTKKITAVKPKCPAGYKKK